MDQEFKVFYQKYFDKLHAYSFTIILDNAEAKDIVQQAFLKLWERRTQVNLENAGVPYVYTIVYNLSLNALRNQKVREKYQATTPVLYDQRYNYLEEKELRIRIQEDIENLPEKCKEIFKKSRHDGMKYSEIAHEMGISIKTVELHMSKALKLLREKLGDIAFIILIVFCHFHN